MRINWYQNESYQGQWTVVTSSSIIALHLTFNISETILDNKGRAWYHQ